MDRSPEHLIREHGPRLRRLAGHLVGEGDEADEVVQRAWLAAWRAAPRRPGPWLERVVRRLAGHARRDEAARRARERLAARPEALPDASRPLEQREALEALARGLAALPAEQAEVVLLRFADGLPPREVAARLGLPVNTVRSRSARGLARLRAEMERGDTDWRPALALLAESAPPRTAAASLGVLLMSSKILVTSAVVAVVAAVLGLGWWRASPASEVQAPTPRVGAPELEAGETFLDAGEPSGGTRSTSDPPSVATRVEEEKEPTPTTPWRVDVRAETEDGGGFGLRWSRVLATRDHPRSTSLPTLPAPHFAHGVGVWRPDGSRGVLEILEEPPVHVSVVVGNTIMDTVRLAGDEEEIVFVVPRLRVEHAMGSFTFELVEDSEGTPPEHDTGFRFAPRGLDPYVARLPLDVRRPIEAPEGPYTLHLGGRSYAEHRVDFEVVAGRCTDLGALELVVTTGMVGHVEDGGGRLVDVPVLARRAGGVRSVGGCDTENFGERFFLGSLPPGELWITVDHPDWAAWPVRFDVPDKTHAELREEDVVVPARRGTPITLVRAPGAHGRARVVVRTAPGQVAWNGMVDVDRPASLRLVPGTYTLSIDPGRDATLVVGDDPIVRGL